MTEIKYFIKERNDKIDLSDYVKPFCVFHNEKVYEVEVTSEGEFELKFISDLTIDLLKENRKEFLRIFSLCPYVTNAAVISKYKNNSIQGYIDSIERDSTFLAWFDISMDKYPHIKFAKKNAIMKSNVNYVNNDIREMVQ